MKRIPRWQLLAAAVCAALAAVSCAINPATGKRQLSLIGEPREIELGRRADREITEALGLYDDEELQSYVAGIGRSLAALSERPDLPWIFRILDDPAVNAFALPGGFIYVTRGILAHFQSEAELAAVLGHEIGHVTARHSVNQMSKAQLAGLGLGLGTIIEPELARFSDVTETGLGLLFLKFGRDDERQADRLGLRYMTRGGYAPEAVRDVFEMLEAVSGAPEEGERVPGWLSTHPAPENRGRLIRASSAWIQASSGRVELTGLAAFVAHEGEVFRLLGYSSRDGWAVHGEAVEDAVGSFRRLEDPSILSTEPRRLEILTLESPATLAEVEKRRPSTVELDTVALINRISPGERLPAGRKVKKVAGGPPWPAGSRRGPVGRRRRPLSGKEAAPGRGKFPVRG